MPLYLLNLRLYLLCDIVLLFLESEHDLLLLVDLLNQPLLNHPFLLYEAHDNLFHARYPLRLLGLRLLPERGLLGPDHPQPLLQRRPQVVLLPPDHHLQLLLLSLLRLELPLQCLLFRVDRPQLGRQGRQQKVLLLLKLGLDLETLP